MSKNKSMLQEQVGKIGLRLGQRRLRELTGRQILATKEMTQPPVSVSSQEKFIANEGVVPPLKTKLDTTHTPYNVTVGAKETQDFLRYSRRNVTTKSPTSQKISFRQLREGADLDFDACMVMEYRMAQRVMEGGDFFEGVRAVVVDKDMSPKWMPATLSKVSEEDVDRYFRPLGEADLSFAD